MVEGLSYQQAAEEEKGGHGDAGAREDAAGKQQDGVILPAAMGEDDQDGADQADQFKIVLFLAVEMGGEADVFYKPGFGEECGGNFGNLVI